jgi:hypothetical protein
VPHEGNTARHAALVQMIANSVAACTWPVRGYVAGQIGLGVAAAGSARAAWLDEAMASGDLEYATARKDG